MILTVKSIEKCEVAFHPLCLLPLSSLLFTSVISLLYFPYRKHVQITSQIQIAFFKRDLYVMFYTIFVCST